MAKKYIRDQMLEFLQNLASRTDIQWANDQAVASPVEIVASARDLEKVNQWKPISELSFMTVDSFELRSLSPYFWYDLEILFRTHDFWFSNRHTKKGLTPKGEIFRTVIWTRIVEDSYDSMKRVEWRDKTGRILESLDVRITY